jgi:plastocyanin
MSRIIQFKRFGAAALANTIGANGEIIFDITNKALTVHDGVVAGGYPATSDTTARNLANAAFIRANTANVTAEAGFAKANSSTALAESGTVIAIYANNASQAALTQVSAAFTRANSANILAQSAYNQANSVYLPSTTRLNVTNNGSSAYLFDQYTGNNATLYVTAGETIAFNLNVTGHPFLIRVSSSNTLYNIGLTHVTTTGTVTANANAQGQVTGTLYWKVPSVLAGNTYVYQCQVHAGMVGNVVIQSANYISLIQLKSTVANSANYAAFQSAIAAL